MVPKDPLAFPLCLELGVDWPEQVIYSLSLFQWHLTTTMWLHTSYNCRYPNISQILEIFYKQCICFNLYPTQFSMGEHLHNCDASACQLTIISAGISSWGFGWEELNPNLAAGTLGASVEHASQGLSQYIGKGVEGLEHQLLRVLAKQWMNPGSYNAPAILTCCTHGKAGALQQRNRSAGS